MTRQFAWITAALTGIIGMLLGIIVSTPRPPASAVSAPARVVEKPVPASLPDLRPASPTSINFADIAARLNPAVVNIDASARSRRARRLAEEGSRPGPSDEPFDLGRQ